MSIHDMSGTGVGPATIRPTVGRIVHYTNLGDKDGKYPPEIQAAIVTRVNADGTLGLWVFYPTGFFFCPSVRQSSNDGATAESRMERGCWHWPPRE